MSEHEKPRARGTGSLTLVAARGSRATARTASGTKRSTHSDEPRQGGSLVAEAGEDRRYPAHVTPDARKLRVEDLLELVRLDYPRKQNGAPDGITENRARSHLRDLRRLDGDARHHRQGRGVRRRAARDARRRGRDLNRELALLRRGFKLAVRKGRIPTAPAVSMRSEAGNERQGFIDPADFEVFLRELRQRDAVVADLTERAYSPCCVARTSATSSGRCSCSTWRPARSWVANCGCRAP